MSVNKTSCIDAPKKILSINHPSQIDLDLLNQDLEEVDYFEFRLDSFSPNDHNVALDLKQLKPWILKSLDTNCILRNLDKAPAFVDLDFLSQMGIYSDVSNKYPVILSAHICADLKEVKSVYESMLNYAAAIYKLVVTPKDQIECLKIVKFFREIKEKNVTRFCMGEDFSYTRYFALIDQHPLLYIGLEGQLTAAGQILLREIKNYQKRYVQPKLLGLIGDPISKSVADVVYNFYFQQKNLSAIYLKIKVKEEEFSEAIFLLKELGFSGLSVTTPLKSKASLFSVEDPPTPCNTLIIEDSITAFNTDSEALINLLEKELDLTGRKVLLLGCGSLAISFAKVLIDKKALVYIKNRTEEKVESLKRKYPVFSFQGDEENFSVMIQATSKEFFEKMYVKEEPIDAEIYVESVSVPIFTAFAKGCLLQNRKVYLGFELFLEQGVLQLKRYFKNGKFDDFFSLLSGLTIKELQRKC